MAVTVPRRARKNPDGRMPLREHLAELRSRLTKSGIAVVVAAIGGWYAYPWLFEKVQQPLRDIAAERGIAANINFPDLMGAFNLHLSMSIYLGLVIASPVWLYQAWAFVVPGLTRKERRHALAFSAVGAPLFVAGVYLGWLVLPNAVTFFAGFAEPGTSLLPSADKYFAFVTRLLLAFGFAFLLPLFLVALNLAGLVRARTLAKGWRLAVFLVFLFAALASPTPDAGSMLALALPMCGLYALAVGVAFVVDRRRDRRAAESALDDGETSPVEAPTPIDAPTPVEAPTTIASDGPESAPSRFDDAT